MLASDVINPAKYLFGDTNGVIATDTVCLAFLNDAMREIARQTLVFRATVTTDGDSIRSGYDMSAVSDLIVINRVTYDGEPLALMTEESVDRLLIATTPDGTPVGYYTSGELLKFFPNAESGDTTAVVIQYSKLLTAAAAVGSTISMPDSWRTELIDFIVMRLHERNENWRAAEMYNLRFNASLANRKYEGQTRDDTFLQVTPDFNDLDYGMYDGYIA
jgi:hypothetical protein